VFPSRGPLATPTRLAPERQDSPHFKELARVYRDGFLCSFPACVLVSGSSTRRRLSTTKRGSTISTRPACDTTRARRTRPTTVTLSASSAPAASAFSAAIVAPMKPYLEKGGHSADVVNRVYDAWWKSMIPQVTLWIQPYMREGTSETWSQVRVQGRRRVLPETGDALGQLCEARRLVRFVAGGEGHPDARHTGRERVRRWLGSVLLQRLSPMTEPPLKGTAKPQNAVATSASSSPNFPIARLNRLVAATHRLRPRVDCGTARLTSPPADARARASAIAYSLSAFYFGAAPCTHPRRRSRASQPQSARWPIEVSGALRGFRFGPSTQKALHGQFPNGRARVRPPRTAAWRSTRYRLRDPHASFRKAFALLSYFVLSSRAAIPQLAVEARVSRQSRLAVLEVCPYSF
jgi:hypothetical protein